jgi:hypothetical protein
MMMDNAYDNQPMAYPQSPAGIQPINVNNGMSDNIASMRWENDPLIINLRITLGAYRPVATDDGQTLLQREKGVTPMVNDLGIDRFVAIIRGVVNTPVSLTNIDDDEANTLIRQILYQIIGDIAYNKDRFAIHDGDRRALMSILKALVFAQLKRPVGGHEAHNFRTQTVEQNVNQQMNMPQRQSASIFSPSSWKR